MLFVMIGYGLPPSPLGSIKRGYTVEKAMEIGSASAEIGTTVPESIAICVPVKSEIRTYRGPI